MRFLITGCEGFVGSSLAEKLVSDQDDQSKNVVYGTYLYDNIQIPSGVSDIKADLLNREDVVKVLKQSNPDLIYHFAAQSSVSLSFSKPELTMEVNLMATLKLLEGIRTLCPQAKLVLISSSEVYGNTGIDPVNEDHPLKPLSPYAASKISAEILGLQYLRSYNLKVNIIRPFPQVGLGQNSRFLIPSLVEQIIRIKLNLAEPVIKVGNLNVYRSYLDIRDALRAYLCIGRYHNQGQIFNLAGDEVYSVEQLLNMLIDISGIKCEIVKDFSKVRKIDTKYQIGSSEKLKSECNWFPQNKIRDSLTRILSVRENEISAAELGR
ncbi:MAG: hypothetical protein APR63_13670 [Desulfuromonas sp. SDB]|nr:MAG: hypothetical protein APR63_13670 [Desulfuromonas sp. SDB]